MKELLLSRITRDCHSWKKGQKVWSLWSTGALAAPVVGRYKGKGRWIHGWVHWPDEQPDLPPDHPKFRPDWSCGCTANARYIGWVDVSDDFYQYIVGERMGLTWEV